MHRCFHGLAKLPKKRNITQTEKRQLDCVYDRSKRNRGYIKEWEVMHGLLTTTKIMQCFALRRVLAVGPRGGQECQYTGTIGIQGNNTFTTDESRTSKVSGGLVNF